ncbi:MAG: M20 aminoacylase family protein [Halopseudomonas aestusnigri]
MAIKNRIAEFKDEMTEWRRHLHANPELALQEEKTSDYVAQKLEEWGIEIHRGIAKTGIVGVLHGQDWSQSRGQNGDQINNQDKAIGIRADMDALPMSELNDFDHKSTNSGRMHACGHDGHTTMLLGAAKYLSETRNFDGTVYFIFQPAEEDIGGGRIMVEEGLFDRFPMDAVYGLHNIPGIPAGEIALREGPTMACADTFDVVVTGKGGHAAMPQLAVDSIVVATQIVQAYQSIVSRAIDPIESAVVSVTQFHAGDAYNVLPQEAKICGTVRTFKPEVRARVRKAMENMAKSISIAHGAEASFEYREGYPVLINDASHTKKAAVIAKKLVGEDKVHEGTPPMMGGEDFSYMLEAKAGTYVFLGNGVEGEKGGVSVHHPEYDFNDDISPVGASFWAELVESSLPRRT